MIYFLTNDPGIFIKKYIKVYGITLMFLVAGSVRIYFTDWNYKIEIIYGLTIFLLLSLIIGALKNYIVHRNLKYIFFDDYIEIQKGNGSSIYALNELELIDRPSKDQLKYGFDFVKLKFKDRRKINFSNDLPFYAELKRFLKSYLYDKVNYSMLLNGEEL